MIEEFNRSKLVSRTYLSQLPLVCTLLDDDECNDFLPESFFQILNRLIDMLLSGLLRFRNQLESWRKLGSCGGSTLWHECVHHSHPRHVAAFKRADSGRSETATDRQVGNVFPSVSSTWAERLNLQILCLRSLVGCIDEYFQESRICYWNCNLGARSIDQC